MKIKMRQKGASPLPEQISALESSLKTKFSADYLNFIAEYNGAIPEANTFRISDNNNSGVTGIIPLDKIAYEYRLLDIEVSASYFPIALAEGGNYVCLPLATDGSGVFFLDHEIPGLASLTKVAETAREFLDQLRPFARTDVKLKPGQVKKVWIDPRFRK